MGKIADRTPAEFRELMKKLNVPPFADGSNLSDEKLAYAMDTMAMLAVTWPRSSNIFRFGAWLVKASDTFELRADEVKCEGCPSLPECLLHQLFPGMIVK